MFKILQINNLARQLMTLTLPNGQTASMEMYFIPQQYGWFITNLTYGDNFVLTNLRICNNPNMLHQFRNLIPFGLACFSVADREPMLQEDFSSGNSELFILSQAEVDSYTEYLSVR